MGYILRDFECPKCGIHEQLVERGVKQIVCCGHTAEAIVSPIHLDGSTKDFNAHYDIQLGKYFGSKEEKKAHLAREGIEQVSGFMSPRTSNKSNIICTREQANKKFRRANNPKRRTSPKE